MNISTYQMGIVQVKAYRVLQAYVARVLGAFDINSTQWSILGQVYYHASGIRFKDIAKTLNVEAPLITMLVDPLLKSGLIDKVTNPTDKRSKLLTLTDKGKILVENIEPQLNEYLFKLMDGISPKEMESYQHVLETIVTNSHHLMIEHLPDAPKQTAKEAY